MNDRIDLLEFQFDKYGKSKFIINFRPIEFAQDIDYIKNNPAGAWSWSGHFRASYAPRRERWFSVSLFERMFYFEKALEKLMHSVKLRIDDIDKFLNGAPPSPFLIDAGIWERKDLDQLSLRQPTRRVVRCQR